MSTLILRPNATGDEESITSATSGVGLHWQDVDEEAPDEGGSIVYTTSASYLRDLYNLPAHTTEEGTINSIKIYFRIATSNSAQTVYAKPSQKSGATVTDGTEVTKTGATTYETFSETYTTNPATSSAYTWDEIDALQVGVQLHETSPYYAKCTQVYVEIDYILSTDWKKSLSDSLAIADVIQKGVVIPQTDAMSLADNYSKASVFSRALADSVALADGLAKGIGIRKADSVAIADALTKSLGLSKTDSVTITDLFTKVSAYNRSIADTIAISDSIADIVAFYLTITDNLPITETLAKGMGIAEIDIVAIADAISKKFGLPFGDSLVITDALAKHIGLSISDNLTIADSLSKMVGYIRAFSDNLAIADSLSKMVSLVKSDVVAIADTFFRVVNYVKILTDSLHISENLSKTMGFALALFDSMAIIDKAKLAYPVRVGIAFGRLAIKKLLPSRMPSTKIHDPEV